MIINRNRIATLHPSFPSLQMGEVPRSKARAQSTHRRSKKKSKPPASPGACLLVVVSVRACRQFHSKDEVLCVAALCGPALRGPPRPTERFCFFLTFCGGAYSSLMSSSRRLSLLRAPPPPDDAPPTLPADALCDGSSIFLRRLRSVSRRFSRTPKYDRCCSGGVYMLGRRGAVAATTTTTHLGKVCGCAQAWELLCRVDAEGPTVAFGPDRRLAVCSCYAREKVEAAVAKYEISFCFYRKVLRITVTSIQLRNRRAEKTITD